MIFLIKCEGDSFISISLLHSTFLYDITRNNVTNPIAAAVKGWIEKIRVQLNIFIEYTERLHKVFVRRANHLKDKGRKLKGGALRRRFFQQTWKLTAAPRRVVFSNGAKD